MNFFDLLLLFFILSSVVPMVRASVRNSQRVRLMQELERKRGSRVIALIHRQETMALLGIPITRYITIQDSEEVLRAIKLTDPSVPIDLILHTPGGLVLAAEQIAHALTRHAGKVTVFVPHYAMSGGTLLALASDEIVMDPNAVLGPVDPQIGQQPAASILTVLEKKDINEVDDETIILADMARKAMSQVSQTVREIVRQNDLVDEAAAERLTTMLTSGTWTHDYPINVEEARELGIPISTDMPREVYKLMELYPQPDQRRPSVSYVPMPYPVREPQPARRER